MTRSKKTIPPCYLSWTIDMDAAVEWMRAANEARAISARLVLSVLLTRAARAAAQVPEMNGFCADDRFTPSAAVHLGVAVALRQGGLVAPAIHDADTLALDVQMEHLKDLVGRVRSAHLQRGEMADPTITVINLGVDAVLGVSYPPQADIGLIALRSTSPTWMRRCGYARTCNSTRSTSSDPWKRWPCRRVLILPRATTPRWIPWPAWWLT